MKTNLSLKALGATLAVAGLTVFGAAIPAQAVATASMSSSTFAANTALSSGLTLQYSDTAQSVTSFSVNMRNLTMPGTCSAPTSTLSDCGLALVLVNNVTPAGITVEPDFSPASLIITLPSSTAVSSVRLDFSANALTAGNVGNYNVSWRVGTSVPQIGYTVTVPSYTVTFKANGASGSDYTQSANGMTALDQGTFNRAGYTFDGWATSPGGNLAYANVGIYNFTANADLYAHWVLDSSGGSGSGGNASGASTSTQTLATTGFDGMPYLVSGSVLAAFGVVLMLFAHRRHTS